MKKLYLFVLLVLLFSNAIAVAQTCDCEALQERIEKLESQFNTQNEVQTENQISPTKIGFAATIKQTDEKYTNYYFFPNFEKLQISKYYAIELEHFLILEDKDGIAYFELEVDFDNQSPFATSFEKHIWIEAYQNKQYLRSTKTINSFNNPTEVSSRDSSWYDIGFIPENATDDITLEIYEILSDEKLAHVATWIIPLSETPLDSIEEYVPTP